MVFEKLENISGKEVLPLVEGGKGISASNGLSAGAWAHGGGVGTFSGVNADYYDDNGQFVPLIYRGKTRLERHRELIEYSIKGGISQAQRARDICGTNGVIHMNVLWEMGAVVDVLKGILEGAKDLLHGVTCGAGMPYKLAEIASNYKVFYHPIVSSARAFKILWKRSYCMFKEWLGSVVYEDPWLAGGHNGITSKEDPLHPEDPYQRVKEIRAAMKEINLDHLPIIIAGGVWWLDEWKRFINNPEIGKIAFQFGTRPLLTQESPISDAWKEKLRVITPQEVKLNKFSPTGFYSSAVENSFIRELQQRSHRQVSFSSTADEEYTQVHQYGKMGRTLFLRNQDIEQVNSWVASGFNIPLKTPDNTIIFVSPEKAEQIAIDQEACMGCLSHCAFSNWKDQEPYTTHIKPDPRSYCIQKTLQNISHNGDIDHELMFSGRPRFFEDPFYAGGFTPTVAQLQQRILTGK